MDQMQIFSTASLINNHQIILQETENFVRNKLNGESTGHDWWHINRVRKLALKIAQEEKADLFVVELAALLHDIADWKFTGGDESIAPKIAKDWLESQNVSNEVIEHVCEIIKNISFKGGTNTSPMTTVEGKVVQDADRLDALGAIGIARCFSYGGFKKRPFYDPEVKVAYFDDFEKYKNHQGTSINHFYEKLLLLKDRMNTNAAKEIAYERQVFMENYLNQFFKEWNV